jgi:hypothetical protein
MREQQGHATLPRARTAELSAIYSMLAPRSARTCLTGPLYLPATGRIALWPASPLLSMSAPPQTLLPQPCAPLPSQHSAAGSGVVVVVLFSREKLSIHGCNNVQNLSSSPVLLGPMSSHRLGLTTLLRSSIRSGVGYGARYGTTWKATGLLML